MRLIPSKREFPFITLYMFRILFDVFEEENIKFNRSKNNIFFCILSLGSFNLFLHFIHSYLILFSFFYVFSSLFQKFRFFYFYQIFLEIEAQLNNFSKCGFVEMNISKPSNGSACKITGKFPTLSKANRKKKQQKLNILPLA